jgi:hypothetical protein
MSLLHVTSALWKIGARLLSPPSALHKNVQLADKQHTLEIEDVKAQTSVDLKSQRCGLMAHPTTAVAICS